MKERWSWKQMPDSYNASYYNTIDYKMGRTFVIVDNLTQQEYEFPITQIKRDNYGRDSKAIVIPHDLWNQEFMNWIASTSPDFGLLIGEEWMTPELVLNLLLNTDTGYIFTNIPDNRLNLGICQKAFDKNPKILTHMPKQFITKDMVLKYINIKNPSFSSLPTEYRNKEIFDIVFNNSDDEHKIKLIKHTGIANKFITKDIVDEILKINEILKRHTDLLDYLPIKFVPLEKIKEAILIDGKNLRYLPLEYITKDISERAFRNNPLRAISYIPLEFITFEMQKYVVDYNINNFSKIPRESLNETICEYAVNISGNCLKHIPTNLKTYDLCLKAVLKNPGAIKYVPIGILNQSFINEINLLGIKIPLNCLKYVNECLEDHRKLEGEDLSNQVKEPLIETNSKVIEGKYTEIRLDNLGFFSVKPLNALKFLGIETIGQLLVAFNQTGFVTIISEKVENGNAINEILGAVRLLRCKYLDEDPLIEEDDNLSMKDISDKFGFMTKTRNSLARYGFNRDEESDKFFKTMRLVERRDILSNIRGMGDLAVNEVIFKVQIVLDYHNRHKKDESKLESTKRLDDYLEKTSDNNTDSETIESLNEELGRLRLELQRINARTDEILLKIQEKMLKESKGGVSR